MKESKIVVTERLRQEGRWEEASQYRDEVRRVLRSQGKPRAEAAEAAWDAMMAKYPPLLAAEPISDAPQPEPEPESETLNLDALVRRVEGNEPDLARDTLWAYENLENRKARPEDAPSVGAWSLLKWAKEYRNRFFEQLVPKAMAARTKRVEEDGLGENADPGLEEVKKMLADLHWQWEESLAKDTPGTIQEKVRDFLSDWTRRFDVAVSAEAAETLRLQMAGLAGDCIKAVLAAPERFGHVSQGV